jgi:15-cis-phytoene synthase
VTARELRAAGITDPRLRAAYDHCRRLNARHGRTYFLATRLLPPRRRPAVHALYGFARWADDIVDAVDGGDTDPAGTRERRAAALDRLGDDLAGGLAGAGCAEPVVVALADTSRRYGIDHRHFADFLTSMRSDLTVGAYPSYADLRSYMHGSAAVIGLQMLPVLGTVVPREEAAPYAAELGVAFQLTNFLRDVGEDVDRGRVYLPADAMAAHGVTREQLAEKRHDARFAALMREMVDVVRRRYDDAAAGTPLLAPESRDCVRAATALYGGILREIERADYRVLDRRVSVSRPRRLAVFARRLTAAQLARVRVTMAKPKSRSSTGA